MKVLSSAKKKSPLPSFSLFIFALFILILLLLFPSVLIPLCKESLLIWYDNLLPVLFPAMIASNILALFLQHISLPGTFCNLLKKLFGVDKNGALIIILGFLAGFPMGSYLCSKLYRENKISKNDASSLLLFCNNIGPVYFFSIYLADYSSEEKLCTGLIFYGVPLFYGILFHLFHVTKTTPSEKNPTTLSSVSLWSVVDYAITDALRSIVRLGGYILCFRIFLVIPMWFAQNFFQSLLGYGITEVTSAVVYLQAHAPTSNSYLLYGLPILTFGGLSGIAQTACMIGGTDLSLSRYVFHKIIQTFFVYSISRLLFI